MNEVHVQTTLPEPVYQALWRSARARKRPVKAVVREAIERYLAGAASQEDPLQEFIGGGSLKERDWSSRKDWRA